MKESEFTTIGGPIMIVRHIHEVCRVFGAQYAATIILRRHFSDADAICSA
jgi:hypothetical protein